MTSNVIDLFSGVGGLSLGAARAGFNVCGAVESDPHATSAHRKNFPNARHLEEDLYFLTGKKILDELGFSKGDIAGVIGGPPCQGFSSMGRRKQNDSRNKLFGNFFKIVKDISPDFFLAENVPGIMDPMNVDLVAEALKHVRDDYEILEPLKLSAQSFGAPTTRTRYIFLGYKRTAFHKIEMDFVPLGSTTVKDAFRGLPIIIDPDWQKEEQSWRRVRYFDESNYYSERIRGKVPEGLGDPAAVKLLKEKSLVSGFLGTIHKKNVVRRFSRLQQGDIDVVSKAKRLEFNGFCPTLRAGTGKDRGSYQAVRPIHPTEDRVITPREAARLQGFPDWFQFSPTKWHSFRQIGNSVSPLLAEAVLSKIFDKRKG